MSLYIEYVRNMKKILVYDWSCYCSQVYLNSVNATTADLTFTAANWYTWQTVYVIARTGDGLDGQDYKAC